MLSSVVICRRSIVEVATVDGDRLRELVASGSKNPLHYRFAFRLRDRVDASGMYRHDLGALVGLNGSVITSLENGRSVPRLDTVERMAEALGISPTWLAFGDEGAFRFQQRRRRPAEIPAPPVPQPDSPPPANRWRGIAERMALVRRAQGLTLRKVAAAAAISPQAVLLIESGSSVPLLSTVERIAVALDVAPGWLAFGEGEGPEAAEHSRT